jgi:hypothetical protein
MQIQLVTIIRGITPECIQGLCNAKPIPRILQCASFSLPSLSALVIDEPKPVSQEIAT